MDYKSFPFELLEAKAAGDGWEFSGYLSTFSNLDAAGDVVLAGAFDRTLLERDFRPLLWGHDQRTVPIGVEKSLVVDDRGLLGTWGLLDTTLGTDAYKALKAGAVRSMSMGYQAVISEFRDDGVRLLKDVDLLEASLVNLPANDLAVVTGVKAVWDTNYINDLPDSAFAVILSGGTKDSNGKTVPRSLRKLPHHNAQGGIDLPHLNNALSRLPQTTLTAADKASAQTHLDKHAQALHHSGKSEDELFDTDVPFDELLGQLKGWLEYGAAEAEALAARREEDERRSPDKRKLSDEHIVAIKSLLESAGAVSGRLEALIAGPPKSEPAMNLRLELARRRLAQRGILEHAS